MIARPNGVTILILLSLFIFSCTSRTGNNKQATALPDSVYISAGNKMVSLTFDTLRQSLLTAISERGIENAINFCNQKAYTLTATYADSVEIRRTSFRYRNPENKPDSLEEIVLTKMETQAPNPEATLVRSNNGVHYFRPIVMQALCLNCHGTPGTNIAPSTLQRIRHFYPADSAINYQEGELRGVWHILFKQPNSTRIQP